MLGLASQTSIIFQNDMELKSDPEMKQDLHNERMQFWENMIWREKEENIERKMLYVEATQFFLSNVQ